MERQKEEEIIDRRVIILVSAVLGLIFTEFVGAPGAATLGYIVLSCLLKLIGYSISLLIVAAVISAIQGKLKTQTLSLFSWLFLGAVILDFGMVAFKQFVVEPEARKVLEKMERRP